MSALAPQLGGKQTPGERADNDANDPRRSSLPPEAPSFLLVGMLG
jgi:hypothetical protein